MTGIKRAMCLDIRLRCSQILRAAFISLRFYFGWGAAYVLVHSLAVAMALFSSSFQLLATSAARGSSGLGAPRRAWIERRMVRIWRAGDQLSGEKVLTDPTFVTGGDGKGSKKESDSLARPGKYVQAYRRWGDRSWSRSGSWVGPSGSHLSGTARA